MLLADVIASKAKAAVFKLLFGLNDDELHVRDMARRSGLAQPSLRAEMKKLHEQGLVVPRHSGNRLYYRANRHHPIYPEIHSLVLKTDGLVHVLAARLRDLNIDLAFVFGSIASGTAQAASDIDLFVIGEAGARAVSDALFDVSDVLAREVNSVVMGSAEFARRVIAADHFVSHVLEGRKVFVIGDDAGLTALVG